MGGTPIAGWFVVENQGGGSISGGTPNDGLLWKIPLKLMI